MLAPIRCRHHARPPIRNRAVTILSAAFCLSGGIQAAEGQDVAANASQPMSQSRGDADADQKGRQEKRQKADDKSDKKKKSGSDEETRAATYLLGFQTTAVLQNLFRFHSPYQGPASLRSRGEAEFTDSNTLFAGLKVARNVELFINPEWLLGSGLSEGQGLSGEANGDLAGQGTLRADPYIARAFVRWRIPTGRSRPVGQTEVGRSENLIPGKIPARRVVITAGKFGANDIFDPSRYANDPHTEFLADVFTNNAAVDFPQDTRGYSVGLTAAWVNPEFALRLGSFEMPTEAGGAQLAGDIVHNRGDLLEAEIYPRLFGRKADPTIVRLLAFRNFDHGGRYQDALAQQMEGMPPDITNVERSGAVKFGYGLSLEQPVADGGKTGAFFRYGWNNGATESYAYDECDRTLTLGSQFSGVHWKRSNDLVALALAWNGLSAAHRAYLEAGGQGIQLGDGRLRYGTEQWIETYYLYKATDKLSLSLHYQLISSPGYNADRGPVSIVSLRLHLELGL